MFFYVTLIEILNWEQITSIIFWHLELSFTSLYRELCCQPATSVAVCMSPILVSSMLGLATLKVFTFCSLTRCDGVIGLDCVSKRVFCPYLTLRHFPIIVGNACMTHNIKHPNNRICTNLAPINLTSPELSKG